MDPYDSDSESTDGMVAARSIKDPIHDMSAFTVPLLDSIMIKCASVPISPRLAMFIDTKQFQRLRNIKQLGTSYYVWPGVAFLARAMASHLRDKQPKLQITERDVECVEIAGLCHDLGHGPWSHVWDGLFMPKALPGSNWKHEQGSVMMFDALVKDNDIALDPKDESFIKALISGEPSHPDEKPFLFDIVANKRNGLDVDKFDYIPRDSHMIGDKMSINLARIINSARVLDNQICYDVKDVSLIYDICATRFKLHKIIYNHKAAKAIEYMIIDALLEAEPHMKIAERVYDPKRYLHLTDNIMLQIEASEDPKLESARAIFDRIRNRQLYKLVDFKLVDHPWVDVIKEYITPEKIVAAAKALPVPGDDASISILAGTLSPDNVICDFSLLHYGMKGDNPLDSVKFYSKRHPNRAIVADRGVYSTLQPQYHCELLVQIFTKDVQYFGIVQAGYRACLAAAQKEFAEAALLANDVSELTDVETSEDAMEFKPLFPVAASTSASFSDLGSLMPSSTPPGPGTTTAPTTAPTTPKRTGRSFSRAASVTFAQGAAVSADATFSINAFTTVAAGFVPTSPLRGHRRKRKRVADPEEAV
ncbi:hypothetical protein H0H81_002737 [Sphagnurus paluster]|uniref:HD domain-containing protein n=1 Tax=Sphagnurus paluster TaxID=117069 RepID=A0A9P7FVK9_9AGAR|nr:hypothetical protein H0H81_002737 [Sphagnurus paluster]